MPIFDKNYLQKKSGPNFSLICISSSLAKDLIHTLPKEWGKSAAKKRVAKIMAKAESTFLLVTQDSFHHMYPKEVGEPYEEDEYDAGEILD